MDEATEFLQDQFAARIVSAGEKRSIAKRTLERAKHQLRVQSTKTSTGWQWELRPSKQK
jgi:hypothetical protein